MTVLSLFRGLYVRLRQTDLGGREYAESITCGEGGFGRHQGGRRWL